MKTTIIYTVTFFIGMLIAGCTEKQRTDTEEVIGTVLEKYHESAKEEPITIEPANPEYIATPVAEAPMDKIDPLQPEDFDISKIKSWSHVNVSGVASIEYVGSYVRANTSKYVR